MPGRTPASAPTLILPLPGKTTFYKLVGTLSAGQYAFGSAVTRRQAAYRPTGMFTPTFAARPGEQVQIDSTPLDVMVLLDSGMLVRADLSATGAQELLAATSSAHLAYNAEDGTPRVIPVGFSAMG